MVQKVHGFAKTPEQSLTGGLKMYTVTVSNGQMTTTTGTEETHSADLDKVIEIISVRAQPVVIGTVGATTLNFAVEHNEIFGTPLTAFNTEATAAWAAYKGSGTFTLSEFTGF
jgi:hypothetical protein